MGPFMFCTAIRNLFTSRKLAVPLLMVIGLLSWSNLHADETQRSPVPRPVKKGKIDEAERSRILQEALTELEEEKGSDNPIIAISLSTLGGSYLRQGKYEEAEKNMLRSLEIWEKILAPSYPDITDTGMGVSVVGAFNFTLDSLGSIYQRQERAKELEAVYLRALNIWEKKFGPDHSEVADILNKLGVFYGKQERYTEAEELHLQALARQEKIAASTREESAITLVSMSLNHLGDLYTHQERYAEAEARYLQNIELSEKIFGPDYPFSYVTLKRLANLYSKTNREKEAEVLSKKAEVLTEKSHKMMLENALRYINSPEGASRISR
ncbi:MAG: tetratricopeptide repeat protein [Azovibrio sp.]